MLEPTSKMSGAKFNYEQTQNEFTASLLADVCVRTPDPWVPQSDRKPFVSVLVPAYNEALILQPNVMRLCQYMASLEQEYRWELVIVNDGSVDETGALAEAIANTHNNVHVIHHAVNAGLGQALKTGFSYCRGDYIITLDLDLSYGPHHIERLLDRIRTTASDIVVTSPYMKGGKVSNVPLLRRVLSVWANRFLSFTAKRSLATLTGMVRAYNVQFLRGLNLRSPGMDVNPELLHKARILNARIEEIPAHLNWQLQKRNRLQRQSSMKILKHIWAIVFSGFLFRPVMFFIIPSLLFFILSVYANVWVVIHCLTNYQQLSQKTPFPDPTEAVAAAFNQAPHAFVIGGLTLMLAIQLFSLGVLAVQNKSYFEEIFYLASAIYRSTQKQDEES